MSLAARPSDSADAQASSIRQWWGFSRAIVLPVDGGTWAATWGEVEDDPDYSTAATIRTFKPPHRMVLSDYRYHAETGPLPFKAEFLVSAHVDGASLRVTQDGLSAGPEADEFFVSCQQGWKETFAGTRRYLDDSGSNRKRTSLCGGEAGVPLPFALTFFALKIYGS